ncbi:hypothetical protein PNK_2385 [Candidatus Protochlamydia naegleriophila]|uniref:Uncharacterized protein n=1 Tax=Candidatus Protochlamydia naegleriophila TaxID=389348 RepID=A0A0U5JFW3_9BACT|nr:terminase small subunit [Candidatus Protochlamydia naegleriophila]CUI17981.1 hypothetical protein PNK_2385 [Candidatus Protochlamydia naegleriophila]
MVAPKNHAPYPGCELGGRPQKYNQEDIENLANEFLIWLKKPENLWFKDFCLEKDIDPDLLSEWAKKNQKFNGVYKLAKHQQEARLIKGGLMNLYNASIVKLVLANAHGWNTDRQQTQVSGDATNPLSFLLKKADGESKDLVNYEQ